jgi:hypothetical protein
MPDLRLVNTANTNQSIENLGNMPGYLELGVTSNTQGSYPFHVDSLGNMTGNTLALSQTPAVLNEALIAGYQTWTYDPTLSIAAGISISTTSFAALIYVPTAFTCSNVDIYQVSGTPNVTVGLWPATAPAGSAVPLAFSAATAATSAAVNTYTFGGSGSASSVALAAGSTYLITVYGSTTGVVGCLTSTAKGANANTLSWSATTTYRAATVGTIAGTLTTSSVFGTSTLSADYIWVGLH